MREVMSRCVPKGEFLSPFSFHHPLGVLNMTFQRKKLASALAHILGAGGAAALVAVPAQAQQDIRVEVTGSNIKRVEAEGALPVSVITKQDIQRSGVQTTMELMDKLSM